MSCRPATAADGYKSGTFHGAGQDYGVVKDILKYVYDKNGGHTTREKVGEVLYNRGVINAIYDLEAIRTAQGKFGKKPLKGEEVQLGIRAPRHHPAAHHASSGADGLMVPIQLSCANHEGNGKVAHPAVGRQALEIRLRLDPAGPQC